MPLSLLGCILLALMLGWALYLLYEMRRRRELLRETEVSCPPSPRHSGEIDVDRSLLFRPTASEGETPYWLVFDTETFDLIPDEDPTEGYDDRPIALSWQLLDEHGVMLLEESYLLTRTEHLSPEATALHGVTDEDLRMRARTPRDVYQLFLRDLSRVQVIVAHHLSFHRGILATDMQREGLGVEPLLSARSLCTMEWGRGWASSVVPRGRRSILASRSSSDSSTSHALRSRCAIRARLFVMCVSALPCYAVIPCSLPLSSRAGILFPLLLYLCSSAREGKRGIYLISP